MRLLYLDESGTHGGDHFVLAGLSVFEHDSYFLSSGYDQLQKEFFPNRDSPVELHAAKIRARDEPPWKTLTLDQSRSFLDRAYNVLVMNRCVLFAVAIERASLKPEDGDEYCFAFESLVRRFDSCLAREFSQTGNRQKGLVIIAESSFRQQVEGRANQLLRAGTRWGELFNQVEIPLFTLARHSRLLQAADLCANAVMGRYERGLARQFDKLLPKFDTDPETGELYGLFHYTRAHASCYCPACLTRSRTRK